MKLPNSIFLAGGIAVLIGGLFSGAVTSDFGHTDDYSTLFWYGSGATDAFLNHITEMGRPVAAVVQTFLFQLGDSIDTVRNIRVLGLIGLWLLILFTAQLYMDQNFRILPAGVIAVCLSVNPASGVFVGWAMTSLNFHAALLAGYSGYLLQSGLERYPVSRSKAAGCFTGSLFLFFISICIYQPTVFFFLMPAIIRETLLLDRKSARFFKPWLQMAAFIFLLVLYFSIYKFGLSLLGTENWATARGQIAADPIAKVGSLMEFPILASISSWSLFQGQAAIIILRSIYAVFILLGCLYLFQRTRAVSHGFNLIAFSLCSYALASSFGPLLNIERMPFRMMPFQYIITGHFVVLGLLFIHDRLKGSVARRIPMAAAAILFLYQIVSGHWVVTERLIRLQAQEYAAFRNYIQQQFDGSEELMGFLYSVDAADCPVTRLQEYGFYSSGCDWVPRSLMTFLLREKAGLPPVPQSPDDIYGVQVLRIYPWQQRDFNSIPYVDSREILTGRETPPADTYNLDNWRWRGRTHHQDPYFGLVETYNDGWFYAPSFGYFRKHSDSVFNHFSLGLMYLKPDGLWFRTPLNGWLRTALEDFPVSTNPETGQQFILTINGYRSYTVVESGD